MSSGQTFGDNYKILGDRKTHGRYGSLYLCKLQDTATISSSAANAARSSASALSQGSATKGDDLCVKVINYNVNDRQHIKLLKREIENCRKLLMKVKELQNGSSSSTSQIISMGDCKYVTIPFEIFDDRQRIYAVMDFIAGGTLAAMIQKMNKDSSLSMNFRERLTKKWVTQLLLGLRFLQSCGIMHNDLKPENVMMTTDNYWTAQVRIVDFGFSKDLEVDDSKQSTAGTPYYRAPERQAPGEDVKSSFLSDMWSVGCIAFELLVGTPAAEFYKHGTFDFAFSKTTDNIGVNVAAATAATAAPSTKFSTPHEAKVKSNPFWGTVISVEAKDFIDKARIYSRKARRDGMTGYTAEGRMNVAHALGHPWVRSMSYLPRNQIPQAATPRFVLTTSAGSERSQMISNAAFSQPPSRVVVEQQMGDDDELLDGMEKSVPIGIDENTDTVDRVYSSISEPTVDVTTTTPLDDFSEGSAGTTEVRAENEDNTVSGTETLGTFSSTAQGGGGSSAESGGPPHEFDEGLFFSTSQLLSTEKKPSAEAAGQPAAVLCNCTGKNIGFHGMGCEHHRKEQSQSLLPTVIRTTVPPLDPFRRLEHVPNCQLMCPGRPYNIHRPKCSSFDPKLALVDTAAAKS